MKVVSTISYLGDLRTNSRHLRSGEECLSDAPVDNNGKGGAFSPTDMIANSLGTCMLTLMGITANKHNFKLGAIEAQVEKEMAAGPRRIIKIRTLIRVEDLGFTSEQKHAIEDAAINCPVTYSLHPDIDQITEFEYRTDMSDAANWE